MPKYPNISVRLVGAASVDEVICRVVRVMVRHDVPTEDIKTFEEEASHAGDHLLKVISEFVNIEEGS